MVTLARREETDIMWGTLMKNHWSEESSDVTEGNEDSDVMGNLRYEGRASYVNSI